MGIGTITRRLGSKVSANILQGSNSLVIKFAWVQVHRFLSSLVPKLAMAQICQFLGSPVSKFTSSQVHWFSSSISQFCR